MEVSSEIRSGVAHITLTNPATGNSLSRQSVILLNRCLQEALANPSCRVIVLAAEGAEFCRGLDLEGMLDSPDLDQIRGFVECLMLISGSNRPVIARVEGSVTGGGVGLVAACDLVFARESTQFKLPEVIVGMIPALITPILLRRISPAKLQYMTISTASLSAIDAKTIGLVDHVIAGEEMEKLLKQYLKQLFRSSPQAIAASKAYMAKIISTSDLEKQMELAQTTLSHWLSDLENLKGIQSFASGESPPWFERYTG